MSAVRVPKREREHRTTVYYAGRGYFGWTCSCGDYHWPSMVYRVASAGARRHRKYMKQLRAA